MEVFSDRVTSAACGYFLVRVMPVGSVERRSCFSGDAEAGLPRHLPNIDVWINVLSMIKYKTKTTAEVILTFNIALVNQDIDE